MYEETGVREPGDAKKLDAIMQEIPDIMEELFLAWVPGPEPDQWPEYLREDPVRGYGLFCFCQGLALGLRLSEACRRN